MKKIQKVNVLEVKRSFVISQLIRKQEPKKSSPKLTSLKLNKRILEPMSYEEFKERLKKSKVELFKLSEKELDKIISDEYKKRLTAFNNSDWYVGEVVPNEVGVWKRSGGLPLGWTNKSLKETAQRVEGGMNKNSKLLTKRVKYAVSNMLQTNVQSLQDEKYLWPIIFQGGTGTRGRKRLKRQMKYDIDDGCMRSIALIISGVKTIKAYIRFPKEAIK